MAKLKARGAITIASSTEQKNEKSQAITTVKKKVTTSYKAPPLTLKMSLKDKESIAGWVDDLQKLSERNVSAAKRFRALALYRDNIDDDELIKLIDKMN
ncbi:hypothetical protein [Vibrio harveyi]|uniref:hypothetical protein n=1 Tax=Vibrio harveyi TaxID=669 RepID=UPI000A17681C|nr:hypothetical protein [Vibrio harveyi]HDM8057064.1 hypothetical protein [Vibrio harveyi]HDM8062829.1 hypothetical protein [Vibrio harveyi]